MKGVSLAADNCTACVLNLLSGLHGSQGDIDAMKGVSVAADNCTACMPNLLSGLRGAQEEHARGIMRRTEEACRNVNCHTFQNTKLLFFEYTVFIIQSGPTVRQQILSLLFRVGPPYGSR